MKKIFLYYFIGIVIFMITLSSIQTEPSPACWWTADVKMLGYNTKFSFELTEDADFINFGDCVYFISYGKNVFGNRCLFPQVIDRVYYTEVCDMRKEKQYGKGSHQDF